MEPISFRPESQHIATKKEKLSQRASKLGDSIKNVFKKASKELEIFHLGGVHSASIHVEGRDASLHTGWMGSYFFERVPVKVAGEQIHFYQGQLKPFVEEWMAARRAGDTQEDFQPFLEKKLNSDQALRDSLRDKEVRYFDDAARQQTVTKIENGMLQQIGLDSKDGATKILPAGTYVFVLARTKGADGAIKTEFFATPKVKTAKGKVQHSSFMSGGNVVSAGTVVVDNEGRLTAVKNQSGHYRPSGKELAEMVSHLTRAGYDTSRYHITHCKGLLFNKLNVKFPRIKWGIVTQRADKWYAETGSKMISPETAALDARWADTKKQALAIIEAHNWIINDPTPQNLHRKLMEIDKSIQNKLDKPPSYVDLEPFKFRQLECRRLIVELGKII